MSDCPVCNEPMYGPAFEDKCSCTTLKLRALVCVLRADRDRLERERARLVRQMESATTSAHDAAHVIVEEGVTPGASCRCDQCRRVAASMAVAGYLDGVADKWWRDPASEATKGGEA